MDETEIAKVVSFAQTFRILVNRHLTGLIEFEDFLTENCSHLKRIIRWSSAVTALVVLKPF